MTVDEAALALEAGDRRVPRVPQRRDRRDQRALPAQGRAASGLIEPEALKRPAGGSHDEPPATPGVSVGALLRSRPEARRPPARRWSPGARRASSAASPARTSRRPASPWPGSTPTCPPGRILILGESEIRYLESLASVVARSTRCGARSRTTFPRVLITGGFAAAAGAARSRRSARACRCSRRRVPTPTPSPR